MYTDGVTRVSDIYSKWTYNNTKRVTVTFVVFSKGSAGGWEQPEQIGDDAGKKTRKSL